MGLGADLHAIEDQINGFEAKLGEVSDQAASFDQQFTDMYNATGWDGIAAKFATDTILPGGQQKVHEMIGELREILDDWRSILGTLSDVVQVASAIVDAASDVIDAIEDIF